MFCIRVNPQFRLLATRKSWRTSGFKLPVCSCQIWSLLCRLPVKLLWLAQKKMIPISTSKSFSTVMYFIILFSFFFSCKATKSEHEFGSLFDIEHFAIPQQHSDLLCCAWHQYVSFYSQNGLLVVCSATLQSWLVDICFTQTQGLSG